MRSIIIILLISISYNASCQKMPEAKRPTDNDLITAWSYSDRNFILELANKYSEKSYLFFGDKLAWPYKNKDTFELKVAEKSAELISPPNMIQISENKFIDQIEIANINYKFFIESMKKDSLENIYHKYLPALDDNFFEQYYENKEFYFHPVVGINQFKASAFCEWRSRQFSEIAYIIDSSNYSLWYNHPVSSDNKYRVKGRLPLESEWKELAAFTLSDIDTIKVETTKKLTEYFKNDRNKDFLINKQIFNSKHPIEQLNLNLNYEGGMKLSIPSYIYSSKPSNSIYNLLGNAMEITEEGFLKGGSYLEYFDSQILEIRYENIDKSVIGFRCICEIFKPINE